MKFKNIYSLIFKISLSIFYILIETLLYYILLSKSNIFCVTKVRSTKNTLYSISSYNLCKLFNSLINVKKITYLTERKLRFERFFDVIFNYIIITWLTLTINKVTYSNITCSNINNILRLRKYWYSLLFKVNSIEYFR